MSTVALTMIVKDEYDHVANIMTKAATYFDQMIFVVSDEATERMLEQFVSANKVPNVELFHRPWNNKFDDARNFAQSKVKTDYWFWIDSDDQFDFRAIPKLVEIIEDGGYDQILLPYNYAQDEQGNCIAFHWRERLLRTAHPFTWKGWVHETPITDVPYKAHRVNVEVLHAAGEPHVKESLDRNHKILLEAVAATDDPRYQLYLGTSHHARGEWGEAIEVLDKFNKVSGSPEDIYRSLCCMSECAYLMKVPNAAVNYALQAAGLIPEHPQAYWMLAQWESEQENWAEGLEWVKVSETKPDPRGMSVYDPTSRDRARLIGAQCEFMLKNYNNALKWLRKVSETNATRQDLEDGFSNEADAEAFIMLLPRVRKYFESEEKLYNALCYDLKYDLRLRGLRELVEKPREWGDKSVVFMCGPGYEEWGPQTLHQGMGGSEEAIVYLSRELMRLGWEVTVYGAVSTKTADYGNEIKVGDRDIESFSRVEGVRDNPVIYLPSEQFNRQDKFNVFVGWRAPEFVELVNAKVKIIDMHDAVSPDLVRPYGDATYFLKSNYHRGLYPKLADDQVRVIGNGIKKDQFHV